MSDDEIFHEVVEDAVDEMLTPTLRHSEDSPRVPSGVSSGTSSGPSFGSPSLVSSKQPPGPKPSSSKSILACPYSGCKNTYKTQKGYENHIFTHKISGKFS